MPGLSCLERREAFGQAMTTQVLPPAGTDEAVETPFSGNQQRSNRQAPQALDGRGHFREYRQRASARYLWRKSQALATLLMVEREEVVSLRKVKKGAPSLHR